MKRICLIALSFFWCFSSISNAAINSQYDFESGVPGFLKVIGNGTAVSSGEKFKDGKSSVKFTWKGQAALTFNNCTEIEASMKVNGAGIIIWIYNTAPMDAPLRFTFWNWSEEEICHFDFNMDFKGWRTAWIKYIDMPCPYGPRRQGRERSQDDRHSSGFRAGRDHFRGQGYIFEKQAARPDYPGYADSSEQL